MVTNRIIGNPSNETLVKICLNAIEEITKEQIFCGIYANLDYFTNRLKDEKIENCLKWVAWWNDEAESKINKTKYAMLQHSSKGKVSGIKGFVDMNISFTDFKKAKEYLERIAKIQAIKLVTELEDLTMQFISCYKFGNDLIDKIFSRLQGEKIKREALSNKDLQKTIKKEFKLETKTIDFLANYIYADFLFEKLYNAISTT